MILPERKGEQQNMKKIAAIMLALLIAGISTGAALAYLTAQESVENRLTAASTDIEITEQFDPPEELHPGTVIPKKVAVTSHSSTDCYVRVLVEFSSWKARQFCEKLEILDGWEKADGSLKTEETPLEPYHITEPMILKKYPDQDTVFEGRLLGGCLDCLVNLKGTEFDKTTEFIEKYKEDGILWFLEACELNVFSIRRAIWQLDHAGWFQYTKGFLIGRPMMFDQPAMGLDQYHAVTDLLAKYQVPVIMDVDLGHLHPAMPLITGSYANVRVEGNSIEIHMECR